MNGINIKVQKAFETLEKSLIAYPTSHDMDMIKRAMQRMYDLGHNDGYAEHFYETNIIDK